MEQYGIRDYCAIGSLAFSVCTFFAGLIAFCILKFNDGVHLSKEVQEFKTEAIKKFDTIETKIDNLTQAHNDNKEVIAVMQERCKLHHVKRKLKA